MEYLDKKQFNFNLKNGLGLNIYCHTTRRRTGFQHRAEVQTIKDGTYNWIDKFYKLQYYDRTWECFTYESLLYHTISKLKEEHIISNDEYDELYSNIKKLR